MSHNIPTNSLATSLIASIVSICVFRTASGDTVLEGCDARG